MSTAVIACQMMEYEIRASMERAGLCCPVFWVERELHNYPDRLRAELQRLLDETRADTVLLAFAQCGNAVAGLNATGGALVLPRFADCVHLLLSAAPGDPGAVDMRTLYAFQGTLESHSGLWKDYDRCAASYGPEKARYMCRLMVAHYRAVSLIDTGVCSPEVCEGPARELAELLGLEYEMCRGGTRVLDKLFTGPWDEEFLVIPKGGILREEQLWGIGHSQGAFV